MMTDEERLELAYVKRREIEQELREAEIIMGLTRKHLAKADEMIESLKLSVAIMASNKSQRKVRKITETVDEQMTEMYRDGKSFSEIGFHVGLHEVTVHRRLTELGVHESRRVLFTEQDKADILRRYPEESARQIGLSMTPPRSPGTITRFLKNMGVPVDSERGRHHSTWAAGQNRMLRTH